MMTKGLMTIGGRKEVIYTNLRVRCANKSTLSKKKSRKIFNKYRRQNILSSIFDTIRIK